MLQNADQNNSEYGHSSRSECFLQNVSVGSKKVLNELKGDSKNIQISKVLKNDYLKAQSQVWDNFGN